MTTPLQSFRVYVPIPFAEEIHEAVSALSASSKLLRGATQAGWIRFFGLGLRAVKIATACREYVAISRQFHAVLEGAASLDLELRPCPKNVDPKSWAEREQERLFGVLSDLRRSVEGTSDLRDRASKLEREIGVLAKEGA